MNGLREFSLRAFIVLACAISVGLAVYGLRIFNVHLHAFAYTADAVVATLFFFSLRMLKPREAFAVLLLLLVFVLGPLTHAVQRGVLVNYTFFFASAPLAIYVYYLSFDSVKRGKAYFRPFILGFLLAATTVLCRLLVYLNWPALNRGNWMEYSVGILPDVAGGFLLGVSIGIGIVLVDYEPVSDYISVPPHAQKNSP
jgi:hypothetical protein